MAIKQILLVLDANIAADKTASLAASIARSAGAGVEAVCLFHAPQATVSESFAAGREAVNEVLDHLEAEIRAVAAPAHACYQREIAGHGLSEGWSLGEIDEWERSLDAPSRLADLVVLPSAGDDRAFRRVTEALILRSGAPCLIVPRTGRSEAPFRRVVLAWNGSREAARAMRDGMPFLRAAANVAVVIGGEEDTRWLDATHAERLSKHLQRHGVEAEIVRADVGGGSAGEVLLAKAADVGADLVIMGAYGHSRAAEAILGGATRTLLSRAASPVLMSH